MATRVGNYIHILRQEQNISMRELARQTGLSPGYLSMIERGHREMPVQTLYSMVEALNGDFVFALRQMAMDAGVPEEELAQLGAAPT
jgi:transcriptional regulator with XRE-family HTH domain